MGASSDQIFMIKTAKKMGLGTVVLDKNKNAPGFNIADIAEPLDFSLTDKVIDFVSSLKEEHIDLCGVNTMGSDIPNIISKISQYFKWEGVNEKVAQIATNKFLMKKHFSKGGFPVPCFKLVENINDIYEAWKDWNCKKIIIKPTDRSGARGVSIISNKDDIISAYDLAIINSNISEVIVEEFVEGPQISTETILYDDRSITPGFADREYSTTLKFHPHIIENGGWIPSNLPKNDIRKIKDLVERASKYLGVERGVTKGDIVLHPIKGPMIIEIAARLSGGDFSESLVPLSSGVNYVKEALKISIDQAPNWDLLKTQKKSVVANRYFFLPEGKLDSMKNINFIKQIRGVEKIDIFIKKGDIIPKLDSHTTRSGVFIVKSKNREQVKKIIDYIYQQKLFKVDGVWQTGSPELY